MKLKKEVCIIFPDVHLPFSPTTLNLKNELSKDFKVTIIAFQPISGDLVVDSDIKYFKSKWLFFRIFNKILQYILLIPTYIERYAIWQKIRIVIYLILKTYDHYIVVDLKSFWFIKNIKKKNIHLLSLELTSNTDSFRKKVHINHLSSIIIQSKERFMYLTGGDFKGKVFYIQNAPNFIADLIHCAPDKNKLIYTGAAMKQFGILCCLNFLDENPQYQLYIQGQVPLIEDKIIRKNYNHLILGNRLIINTDYLNSTDLINYLSQFRIGFCFYDLTYKEINNFNYKSAPSGKMFAYFAAGVPVIGIDIPGLNPISEFKAGIQISNLNSEEISNAIKQIEADYELYSSNCLLAAKHFDFYKNSIKFINYLKTSYD